MLNRLLYQFYQSPNNGRQIVGLADGRRLLLIHSSIMGPATLQLKQARETAPKFMADFEDLGILIGPGGAIPSADPWGFGASLVRIEDTLHCAWTGPHGIYHSTATINKEHARPRLRWSAAEILLHGDYRLGDLFPVEKSIAVTYHLADRANVESIGIAWLDHGKWKSRELFQGEPMFAPVADVDEDGPIHLTWADVDERLRYLRLPNLQADGKVENLGFGKQPTIIVSPGQVLIGCEDEYQHICYYAARDDRWQQRQSVTAGHKWFAPDLLHSPQLCRDRHDVVWLFFADNTRKSTFWTRWMGDGFNAITNGPRLFHRSMHFDSNLLPIGRLSVEKPGSPSTADIGMLLNCEPPIDRIEYRREVVPDVNSLSGEKTLFLDMLEIARAENVRLKVQQARKHPQNPLMQLGPNGAFDEDRVFNGGNVILDGGIYRMWYGGLREPRPGEPPIPWWDWIHLGYAESKDGIEWRRVPVGLIEWNGSKNNNIVPHLRNASVVIKDDREPDPKRRYRAFKFWNSGEHFDIARDGKYGRTYDPRCEKFLFTLYTSPDGIRFTSEDGEVVFPEGQAKPTSAIPQTVFRDEREIDPAKRFKAYGFMSLNLRRRGTCYLYSPDGKHWTAHPEMPLIDPAVRGNPPAVGGPTGQVHDTICFPYEGYYIALYQCQHDPRNMPIELAVSRDGESFHHVQPGQEVLPLGRPDAFDALMHLISAPIVLEHEIRIYYGGSSEIDAPDRVGRKRWRILPGLATVRRDGITAIELNASKDRGFLETIPFPLTEPRTLSVNASCGPNGRLLVELVDASTGAPLPGYSVDDCQPVLGDQLDAPVAWKTRAALPTMRQPVRLRFHLLRGERVVRLYAFRFGRPE